MTAAEQKVLEQAIQLGNEIGILKTENKLLKEEIAFYRDLLSKSQIIANLPQSTEKCDRCGCHPTIVYHTPQGRLCQTCKNALGHE